MITKQGFDIAIAWLKISITKRDHFVCLDSDIDALMALQADGVQAFNTAFKKRLKRGKISALDYFEVPKAGGKFRHGYHIPVKDRLATLALVTSHYGTIRHKIAVSQPDINYAHPLPTNPMTSDWFMQFGYHFRKFRERTADNMARGNDIFFTDIKSFSASCDIDILEKNLIDTGIPQNDAETLCMVLRKWRDDDHLTGLPQASCMGDVLTKIYMLPVDRLMQRQPDIDYYRYNDDIRIASKNPAAMARARAVLMDALQKHGLHTNPEKTGIMPAGISPDTDSGTENIRLENYFHPCSQGLAMTSACAHVSEKEMRQMLASRTVPDALLQAVYKTHIAPRAGIVPQVPQALFNYTMLRLAESAIEIPASDLPAIMRATPERMGMLLDYIRTMHNSGGPTQDYLTALHYAHFGRHAARESLPYTGYQYIRFLADMQGQMPACKTLLRRIPSLPAKTPQSFIAALEEARATLAATQAYAPKAARNPT